MGTNERRKKLFVRQAVILAALVVILAAGSFVGIRKWRLSQLVQIQFSNPDGSSSPVLYLESARTSGERAQGLMYRSEIPEDGGMMFIYPDEGLRSFYMKNTKIPLDMIHVARDGKVVGIVENAPILNEDSRSIGKPAMYVVEVRGNSSKKWRIQAGSQMQFKTPAPAAK